MASAARNLTPVTLELGGKSPAIVAPDYPIKTAAERIMWAKMLNAGQVCMTVDYVFLPRGSETEFVDHAKRLVAGALSRSRRRRLHLHHRRQVLPASATHSRRRAREGRERDQPRAGPSARRRESANSRRM